MKVGVISDTHGLLRPQVAGLFAGVGHIIHAGDIGAPGIVDVLGAIAPVTAVRGNVDTAPWAAAYPYRATVTLGGRAVHVLHDLQQLGGDPVARGFAVVVSGHSHRPRLETLDGVLYLNPGSAGPRRFTLPVTLAILDLDLEGPRAEILELA